MTGRRIRYLGCLAASLVFYFCYQGWMAWMVLVVVALVPWVSLALSLPAILGFRAELDCPAFVGIGDPAFAALRGSCEFPMPLFRGKLYRRDLLTGDRSRHQPKHSLPTDHCGAIRVTAERVRVCDYLGLFALPVRNVEARTVVVRPRPLALENPPDLSRYMARSWRPKFGGGYAENHELRLYRPGDSLNQVHWKLSAKTGELILREPMEPNRALVLLTMDLSGSRDALDRKFGRLLTASRMLIDSGLHHEIRVLTADGPVRCAVSDETELTAAVDRLLGCPAVKEGTLLDAPCGADWQYHIGGDGDEA